MKEWKCNECGFPHNSSSDQYCLECGNQTPNRFGAPAKIGKTIKGKIKAPRPA